jgi:uncharacterized membrane protein
MDIFVIMLGVISTALSAIGVLIVLFGGLIAGYGYFGLQYKEIFKKEKSNYTGIKNLFIQKILLSLDFFVGSDLVRTIAAPDFKTVGLLAAIVAIRIALSYSLNRELKEKA